MENPYLNAHYGMLLFLLKNKEKVQEVLNEVYVNPLFQTCSEELSYIDQLKCINQVILHKRFADKEELLKSYESFMFQGRHSKIGDRHQTF